MTDQLAIQAEDLHYGYLEAGQHHPILRGAGLRIAAGEAVALLGRSGSGKSTLLNVVSGLAPPASGRVWVGGRELTGAGERERTIARRRSIGFVYQFFNLIDTLNVLDNALLPVELDRRIQDADRDHVMMLLDRVGLAARTRALPDALSGGEQQRVALVRALAAGPAVVLADEPTGNLDVATGATVLGLLDELVRGGGRALVLVTHSPEVAAHCDRVLHIEDGVIEAP